MTSNVEVDSPGSAARQVLRTIADSSASRVEKLCAGVPSASLPLCALMRAVSERFAGAVFSNMK